MQIHHLKLTQAIGMTGWWHRDRDALSPVVRNELIDIRHTLSQNIGYLCGHFPLADRLALREAG